MNEEKKGSRQAQWCGETVNGSLVRFECPVACDQCAEPPVAAPVEAPVTVPVAAPVAAPTVECILEANLAFPFNTADEAPYYGYHADYMEVTKEGDDVNECSWTNSEILPLWCT